LYPRKKTAFFLNGILYSLDEGLLMGDPYVVSFSILLKKRVYLAVNAITGNFLYYQRVN
jgi:hypothetical protein